MAPDKPDRARRFTKEERAQRIIDLKDQAGLAFNLDDAKAKTVAELKRDIPKLVYEAMWMSVQILIHEHLRSKDPQKKKAAAAQFLDKLSDQNFIKNLALIKEEAKPGKPEKPKAEWNK